MDHVSRVGSPQDSAGLVKPVNGGGSTPLVRPEFNLVAFDNFGCPEPLPPGLGNLPLSPDNDGTFSVNGPLDFTAFFPHEAPAHINSHYSVIGSSTTGIAGFSCESPHSTSTADCVSQYTNDDAITSGPQEHFKRKSYLCREPGCTWRSSFPTKQALDRHHEVKHLNKRIDCPIPGCERVGDKGIKRKDNLPAHVLNKHGIKLCRQPRSN